MRNRREQRHEGTPVVTNHRGFSRGSNPWRVNPTNATHLKMVGRRGEEEVAARLGKPVSDTVVGGLGAVGRNPGKTGAPTGQPVGTWTLSSQSVEGARNPKRGASRRETGGGEVGFNTV
jgi:hypothetical protein